MSQDPMLAMGLSNPSKGMGIDPASLGNSADANVAAIQRRLAGLTGSGGAPSPASATGTSTGPGTDTLQPATGSLHQWIQEALKATGQNSSLEPGLRNMIMHESGGNPNAINNWDSNAKAGHPSQGLMQTIPGTFNEYALPGHNQILNPIDNIIAGLRYALSRYGPQMVEQGGRHDSSGHYLGY